MPDTPTPQDWKPEELEPVARALGATQRSQRARGGEAFVPGVEGLSAALVRTEEDGREQAIAVLTAAIESGLVVRAEELAAVKKALGKSLAGQTDLMAEVERVRLRAAERHLALQDERDRLAEELAEARAEVERLQQRVGEGFANAERAWKHAATVEAERDSLAARLEAAERVRDRLRAGAETCRQAAVDCEARNQPRRARIWREVYLARSEAADALSDALGENDHAT